jgi:hypothetical protein
VYHGSCGTEGIDCTHVFTRMPPRPIATAVAHAKGGLLRVDRGPWAAAGFSGLLGPPQDVDKGVIGVCRGFSGDRTPRSPLIALSG